MPNEVVDEGWLKELKGTEFKVLVFLIRKTFGFNKINGDRVPFSQIIARTGVAHQSAIDAVQVLEKCKLIRVLRGRTASGGRSANFYQLITRQDYNRSKQRP